jgi:hypothetical protein
MQGPEEYPTIGPAELDDEHRLLAADLRELLGLGALRARGKPHARDRLRRARLAQRARTFFPSKARRTSSRLNSYAGL